MQLKKKDFFLEIYIQDPLGTLNLLIVLVK